MYSRVLAPAISVAILTLPTMASALVFTGDFQVQANFYEPGLTVTVDQTPNPFSTPDLAVGDHYEFSVFDIWTNETEVLGDDLIARPISVKFNFNSPETAGKAMGTTSGFDDFVQLGEVTWDNPTVFSFGQGGTGKFSVELTNAIFNEGVFGLEPGPDFGETVLAKLTYDVAPVPLPATLPLLLGGLGIAGAMSRRARRTRD